MSHDFSSSTSSFLYWMWTKFSSSISVITMKRPNPLSRWSLYLGKLPSRKNFWISHERQIFVSRNSFDTSQNIEVLIHLFSKLFQILDENFLKTLWWFFSRFCDNFSFNFCWDFWWKLFKIFSQYFYQNFVIIFHSTFDEIFYEISSNFLMRFSSKLYDNFSFNFWWDFLWDFFKLFMRFLSKLYDNFSCNFLWDFHH